MSRCSERLALKVRVLGRQTLHWDMEFGSSGGGGDNKIEHLNEEVRASMSLFALSRHVLTDCCWQINLAEEAVFADGDLVFPFSCQLPDDLQHTISYVSRRTSDMRGICMSVEYEVETVLSAPQSKVAASASFRVDPVPTAVPFGRLVQAAKEESITFMGLVNRGACGVALSVDMDVLDSSSAIEARVALDLKTSQAVKSVTLVLYQRAVVDRHHRLYPAKIVVNRQVCSKRLDKAALNLPSNGLAGSTELTIQLPLSPNKLAGSDPLSPTMTSHFVNISYRVEVEVKFPMVPRIIVGVPVTVVQKLVAPQELEVASVP
jgi:hypothetical protein